MRIAIVGSLYGHLSDVYRTFGKLVHDTEIPIDWVLSTGNFGVWPDPLRADRASRENPGEFLDYLVGKKRLPIPTIMVAGKHEDHLWIEKMVRRGDGELIENLHFLVNGNHTLLENLDTSLKVVGIGGTYSPEPTRGNYTMGDVAKACTAGPMDIFLSHEAPDGQRFEELTSQAKGLNKVCFATRPRLLIHGKYSKTLFYKTTQTLTNAICVGNRQHVILDIDKDSIKVV